MKRKFVAIISQITVTEAGAPGPASPLGALQPDLYQRQEGPVYITAPDSSIVLGKLHLAIKYDSHLFDLAVHVVEGKTIKLWPKT